jgi:uncharacterized protein (TIGR03435 family)
MAFVLFGTGAAVLTPLLIWRAAVTLAAQSASVQAAPRVEFDVASVKLHTGDTGGPRGISFSPSGRFAWNQMTLKELLPSAYAELSFKQMAGGPAWIGTQRFDIAATSADALNEVSPDGTPRGLFTRLRTLLEDRFQLKTHIEQREGPVYALQAATTPIVMGPSLRATDINCEVVIRELAEKRPAPTPEGQMRPCALRVSPGQIVGHAMTMAQLVDALAGPAGRPVVDRSGLTRSYDLTLKWAPEFPAGTLINGAPPPPSDGPSLFTAIREQLGLKLEATRAPVPVLVIDSVRMPTPD